MIATLSECRGRGHGATLMDQAEALARDGRHPTVALVVSDANADAIRLYHRRGFSERARRPKVKGDWEQPGNEWVLPVKPLEVGCEC